MNCHFRRNPWQGEGLPEPPPRKRLAYHWVDATYLKVWRVGLIVSVAVIIAIGIDRDGRREVLGLEIGTSEAEPIWTEFIRKLTCSFEAEVVQMMTDSCLSRCTLKGTSGEAVFAGLNVSDHNIRRIPA